LCFKGFSGRVPVEVSFRSFLDVNRHQCRVVVLLFQTKKRSFFMKAKSALTVALAAGIASTAAASNTPTTLSPTAGKVNQVAHIYFNIATGERVVTLLGDGQTAPADTGEGGPIWSTTVGNQCSEQGFTTSFFFGVDDNSGTSSLATDITNLDFGDIATDTVVDCVFIDWVTDHIDVDADSDGIGDGVVGLSGQWTYWDADNGRTANRSTRLPLVSFIFTDLPGDTSGTDDPDDPANTLAGYTATVDLAASFSSSLTFEIGDSDGDLQGAAFANNDVDTDSDGIGDGVSVAAAGVDRDFDGNDDADLDGDGLFDFAWTVRFGQPGTRDLDSDGTNEGDIAASMRTIGITFGAPEGEAVDDGAGGWTWETDAMAPGAGTGWEDAFAIYAPPDLSGEILHAGFFWFGGISCTADPVSGQYNPGAGFTHTLFGPGGTGGCAADLTGDGNLNFFDVSAFLAAYGEEDPIADFTGDGNFNFFDVSEFLAQYGAGCP
jgi:hypothetical protein